jgi:hypothetical protein
MLRKRPAEDASIETINDRNGFVANFWRAVHRDPDAVAHHADWPVIEADLHARHRWLVGSDAARAAIRRVCEDPDAFDAKIAGWWCWGACCWIGSGWCDETPPPGSQGTPPTKFPHLDAGPSARRCALGQAGWGLNVEPPAQLPDLAGDAGATGRGIVSNQAYKRVRLSENGVGTGVCAHAVGGTGACADRARWIRGWMVLQASEASRVGGVASGYQGPTLGLEAGRQPDGKLYVIRRGQGRPGGNPQLCGSVREVMEALRNQKPALTSELLQLAEGRLLRNQRVKFALGISMGGWQLA